MLLPKGTTVAEVGVPIRDYKLGLKSLLLKGTGFLVEKQYFH